MTRTIRPFLLASILAASIPAIAMQRRAAAPPPPAPAPEQHWRVWGGPRRDFVTLAKGLFPAGEKWISTPPKKLWERPLGDGYSGIAVEDGVLYTGYRQGHDDVFTAIDAATGKTIWEFRYAAPFQNQFGEIAPGPYAMPQIAGDRLVTASGIGQIHSLDKKTGKPVWSIDLYKQSGGTRVGFGYSSHALPYKDSLIVLAGGDGKAVQRLRQTDGTPVWQKQKLENAYSSPILIDVDGQPQVVALLATEVVGLDPESGELLWRHPHSTEYGIAVSTPVWAPGNLLFISSAYNTGARVLKLAQTAGRTTVQEVWSHPRIQAHFGTVIRQGGFVYLSSGQSIGIMTGVELATGRITWQARDFVKAQLVAADGKLIILDEDGNLGLGVATPERFQAVAKWPMLSHLSWTPPTLAGKTLYIRDRKMLMAVDVGTIGR